jgi:hypothetical protein
LGIYDRDWYRDNKTPSGKREKTISRGEAERLKRMVEGNLNEPPKVDPKYRFEFADTPTGSSEQSSNNGYDPTYGCGYQSSTVKQGGQHKYHSTGMKTAAFVLSIIGSISALFMGGLAVINATNSPALIINSFGFCFGITASVLGITASVKRKSIKALSVLVLIFGIITSFTGNFLTGLFFIPVGILLLKHLNRYGPSPVTEQYEHYRNRGLSLKPLSFIILAAVIGYVTAVGYNVVTITSNLRDEQFIAKNNMAVAVEVGSRLGLVQSLGIIGNAISGGGSIWENPRVMRESINVVYDWYAPVKWSPVLSLSKELTWFTVKAGSVKTNQAKSSPISLPSSDYGYVYVKSDALNVRSGPSANNRVIATLRMNSKVQVINKTGVWWKIKYGNLEGYVNSQFLGE